MAIGAPASSANRSVPGANLAKEPTPLLERIGEEGLASRELASIGDAGEGAARRSGWGRARFHHRCQGRRPASTGQQRRGPRDLPARARGSDPGASFGRRPHGRFTVPISQ